MNITDSVKGLLTSTPVLRTAFSLLRRTRPVAIFGKTAIVTRYKDVMDVLVRENDFTVYEIDGWKMDRMGNIFVLGMDASPQTTLDRNMLKQVIKREDLDTIRVLIKKIAGELIAEASVDGKIDVVNGYARLASVRIVAQYFGVPADEKTMMHWQRSIFSEAFANLTDNKAVRERGLAASKEISDHLKQLIASRKQEAGTLPDNILNRLIRQQKDNAWLDDNAVRRLILCILGVVENTSKAVTHMIDQLLKRPEIYKQAATAARNNDITTVHKYAFEALRFNPHNPVILRYCKNGAVIGNGTRHERTIPPKTTVYAATLSAMFDPEVVSNPDQFDPERKTEFMHFGYGPHICVGRYVSEVTIPEMIAGLLRLKNLRRAPGPSGRIVYEELVFPKRLVLEFDT